MPDPFGPLETTWPLYASFLLAYLVGSIPFGLVLTRMAGLGDIRAIGSRNIGATNVLRTGRKGLAAATLLLDGGKGILAVAVGWQFGTDFALLAAIGAVLGHCFPVWLKFKGGKGVATAIGVWLALVPNVGVIVCGLWLAIAFVFRYSSAAALVAMAVAPFLAWHLEGAEFGIAGGVIAAIIWLRHHQNIRRLIKGEESKISFGKK